MSNTKLGPRPDPSQIKFTEDCFETVGQETYYTVSRSALHSGPARFADLAEAQEYAKRVNRKVSAVTVPVRTRVKWF